jgi:hypothetical protein
MRAEILAFGLSACTQPSAAAFALKAAGFDFSSGSSPSPRLRTFPAHQFDFDPAAQRFFMAAASNSLL